MYDEILIPTDGGPAAHTAVSHAINLAQGFDARVHALFVVDAGAYAPMGSGAAVLMDALRADGEDAVQQVTERATEVGLDTVDTVTTGTAHSQIIEYADQNAIDLIVMGTHGRQGLDRYLLGSVTERVVRSADVPVLTVSQPDED